MINYIRVFGSLQILTFSSGFYITFLCEFLLFLYNKKVKRETYIILYSMIVFLSVISLQFFLLNNDGSTILATVTDPLLRLSKSSTLGHYLINGDVLGKYVFLTICYMFYVFFLCNNLKDENDFWDLIKKNIIVYLILSIIIFVLTFNQSLVFFIKGLSGFSPNYLTQDEFGYRISVGFFEPSMMSVYISTILAIAIKNKKIRYISIFTFVVLFLLSRSGSLLILYLSIIVLINYKVKVIPFIVFVFLFILLSLVPHDVVANLSQDVFFLRSLSERLFFPDINLLSYPFFIGIDYGNVTTFFPIISIIIQVGVLGSIIFFIITRCNLSLIVIIFLLISVSRNIASYELWMAIFFLISMSHYLELRLKVNDYYK